jgi:ATP phosphoribosyltransferase regulatory subunit
MAGEDLRRRIYLTESETGETLCLRPEFTIPVCLSHIKHGADTPARYAYLGEVFRQRRAEGQEFFQSGIEDLGNPNIADADARSLVEAVEMVRLAAPQAPLDIVLGDQSIFEAVLKALGLPRGWRMRLARTFGNAAMLKETLHALSSERPLPVLSDVMAKLAVKGDLPKLSAAIAAEMATTGFPAHAGRTPDDIAARLVEKSELASAKLSKKQFSALSEFLAIHEPLSAAGEHLARFAHAADISLANALRTFDERIKSIKRRGLDPEIVTYDAAFGRPLDYYTGLVFEVRKHGSDANALAGGGRYDRLLTLLGAQKPIPGVGFSLWLDRLEALG